MKFFKKILFFLFPNLVGNYREQWMPTLALVKVTAMVMLSLIVSTNVSAQIDTDNQFDTFSHAGCNPVHVVYLQKNTPDPVSGFYESRLFEVEKPDDGEWRLVNESLAENNGYNTAAFEDYSREDYLLRFKFGPGVYKKYCVDFQEELPIGPQNELGKSVGGDSGIDLVSNYISMIYRFGSMIIGLVCVLIIVISGLQIIMGGMSPDGVSQAKTRILGAILSMVLLFGSAMILRFVNPGFFT